MRMIWPRSLPALLLPVLTACGGDNASSTALAAKAERGRQRLQQYHCGQCHVIPGVASAQGSLAASLAQYGRRSYIAGRLPNDAATLARWVQDPPSLVPDTAMPDMGVSPADAEDIAAYLVQLR